ncbi:BamA/TamA family outer membrane protein [Candidatus Eisenbacteria bacterium]|uniref:BamA/TamA family outer membrane protein n=1 Tax=Eiseniibacteriota bacterium TaxID=2212470 RepID=A0ABV6YMR9_UNCEI
MMRLLRNGPVLVLALALMAVSLWTALLSAAEAPAPAARALLLEEILISGNKRLADADIRNTIQLAPGDTINVEVLERERLRLLDAHSILTSASLFTRPGSTRGTVILEIDIVEKKTVSFETGYGYHDVNGWFLTLAGVRFDQLFKTDSVLRVGFRLGFRLTSFDAEWVKPAPLDGGLGANARFHVQSEDRSFFGDDCLAGSGCGAPGSCSRDESEWNEFRQKIERVGGEVSALHWYHGMLFSFGMQAESVKPESTFIDAESDEEYESEDFPGGLAEDVESTVITGLFLRVTRDTRDDAIYPRSGSVALLSLEANNTFLGGDEVFTKLMFDSRGLLDLGGDRVLSGRLSAGITSTGTPYHERFTLGGIYSMRGFKELSLSPAAGFDGYWLAGCELRFPLIPSIDNPPRLVGLVFFDTGMGWQRHDPCPEKLEAAIGYGVRLRLPWLGMLGLDAGIPLSEGRTGENFRVHGSLGFSF